MDKLNQHLEESKKYVTEDDARTAYLRCRELDKSSLIADGVHLVEFAENLIALVGKKIAQDELNQCIKVVQYLNPVVAKKLKETRDRP